MKMRHRTWWFAVGFLILSAGFESRCIAQVPSVDVYKILVGSWVGTDDYVQDGQAKHIPVSIVITESKDHKSVRLDTIYSSKGEREFSKATKFMSLDVANGEMRLGFKGDHPDIYRTQGLDEFARSAQGKFTASGRAPGPHSPGDGAVGRFTLDLGADTLFYKWESQDIGSSFVTVSTFALHRSDLTSSKN
jgi:hypothetical protein